MTDDKPTVTRADQVVVREAVERACAAEGVDIARLENFVKVANMDGNERLVQSRWVRVIWRLLAETKAPIDLQLEVTVNGESVSMTNAECVATLAEALTSTSAWQPNARLLGDVRAGDLTAALVHAIAQLRGLSPEKWFNMKMKNPVFRAAVTEAAVDELALLRAKARCFDAKRVSPAYCRCGFARICEQCQEIDNSSRELHALESAQAKEGL